MSICHHCGKKIEGEGVPFQVDTYTVRMHQGCRRWYPRKPITAREPDESWQGMDGKDPPDSDSDP